jgi:hypothetical protein
MHPTTFGSSRNMNVNEHEAVTVHGQAFSRPENGKGYRSPRPHIPGTEFSRFSNSVAIRGSKETTVDSHWPEEHFNARYNHLDNGEATDKHQWSQHLLDRPKSSYKKDEQPNGKESGTVQSDYLLTSTYLSVFNLTEIHRKCLCEPYNCIFHCSGVGTWSV